MAHEGLGYRQVGWGTHCLIPSTLRGTPGPAGCLSDSCELTVTLAYFGNKERCAKKETDPLSFVGTFPSLSNESGATYFSSFHPGKGHQIRLFYRSSTICSLVVRIDPEAES